METRLARNVQHEFDEACVRYLEADPNVVAFFRAETARLLLEITHHPLRFPKVSARVRRALFHRQFPYAILYQVRKDHILILAIMHTSRSPGYWRGRMTKK
jgi:toxin ParE1/3/4